ncbi:MAG: DUF3276 family protein [Treponema sp.]|nr:DUF3276 family protein [Treponema sp.]
MGIRGEIYSNRIILPNRTYFFNVKENRMGDLYLNIVESKNRENGGFDRQSVILFADDLQVFLKGFDESLKALEKSMREKRHSGGEIKNNNDSKRENKFRRTERSEERDHRGERGERKRRSDYEDKGGKSERGERDRPRVNRKSTSDRWSERGERKRNNPGGEKSSRSQSGERDSGGRRSSPGSDTGKRGSKRVIVRKRDRDN